MCREELGESGQSRTGPVEGAEQRERDPRAKGP